MVKIHFRPWKYLLSLFLLFGLSLPNVVMAAEFMADMIQKTPLGEFTGKVYVKGKNIRREISMMGQKHIMICQGQKRVTYILLPQQMVYMEMKWSTKDEAKNCSSIEELKRSGKIKYLGVETVSGFKCKKYRYMPNDPSAPPLTVWISEKLQYPIKMEITTSKGTVINLYKNIKEKKISNSLFEVPDDYEKMTIPMLPNLGN